MQLHNRGQSSAFTLLHIFLIIIISIIVIIIIIIIIIIVHWSCLCKTPNVIHMQSV